MKKIFIIISIFIYFVGIAIGYLTDPVLEGFANNSNQNQSLTILEIDKILLLKKVIKNNLLVLLMNVFGAFSFGFISIINTIYNGLILGYSLRIVANTNREVELIQHFLPHSLEIIAIVISCAIGTYLGFEIFRTIFLKRKIIINYLEVIKIVTISILIVVISAFVEVYISMS